MNDRSVIIIYEFSLKLEWLFSFCKCKSSGSMGSRVLRLRIESERDDVRTLRTKKFVLY